MRVGGDLTNSGISRTERSAREEELLGQEQVVEEEHPGRLQELILINGLHEIVERTEPPLLSFRRASQTVMASL